jgi:hypothetical protein
VLSAPVSNHISSFLAKLHLHNCSTQWAHSRLDYRTPTEVRKTWDDANGALQKQAA